MRASLDGVKIGIAITGSFCTIASAFSAFEKLKLTGCELFPILSLNAASLDTRFFSALELRKRVEDICGRKAIDTIATAEPIGPKKLLDAVIVAPCTGNSCAKLACGITDTPVLMACKSHLRNERPVLIAISSNDGLSAGAKNIAELLNRKNVFFVPFGQDDPVNKPRSLATDYRYFDEAVCMALERRQIQPLIVKL